MLDLNFQFWFDATRSDPVADHLLERLALISFSHINHPPFVFLFEAVMLCEHSEQFQAFEKQTCAEPELLVWDAGPP
jgi:hypothetical protein